MTLAKLGAAALFIVWLIFGLALFCIFGQYYRFFFNDPWHVISFGVFRITFITPQVWLGIFLSIRLILYKNYRSYVLFSMLFLLLGGLWTFAVWYAVENS